MAFRHLARTSLAMTWLAALALTTSAAGVAAGEVTVGSNYSDAIRTMEYRYRNRISRALYMKGR